MYCFKRLEQLMKQEEIEVYIVGGYVRDRLLGNQCKDHDFVVVGTTPQDMIECGFTPVGADFPVFLAENGDEYALARIERKVGPGYHGFQVNASPDVTLFDDLRRRDLTVNAMARKVIGWNDQGHAKLDDEVVDYFGGVNDLEDHVLKAVGPAFKEDPLRTLRTCRFRARYGFDVCDHTKLMMKEMVDEYQHLTPERVWVEIEKTLGEKLTPLFFDQLNELDLLESFIPGFNFETYDKFTKSWSLEQKVKFREFELPVKVALTWHQQNMKWLQQSKAPNNVAKFATLMNDVGVADTKDPNDIFAMFKVLDVFRNPNMIRWCQQYFDFFDEYRILVDVLNEVVQVKYTTIDSTEFDGVQGSQIGEVVDKHRLLTIQSCLINL